LESIYNHKSTAAKPPSATVETPCGAFALAALDADDIAAEDVELLEPSVVVLEAVLDPEEGLLDPEPKALDSEASTLEPAASALEPAPK